MHPLGQSQLQCARLAETLLSYGRWVCNDLQGVDGGDCLGPVRHGLCSTLCRLYCALWLRSHRSDGRHEQPRQGCEVGLGYVCGLSWASGEWGKSWQCLSRSAQVARLEARATWVQANTLTGTSRNRSTQPSKYSPITNVMQTLKPYAPR